MFGSKAKRPWKDYAKIERVEYNSGDVKFSTDGVHGSGGHPRIHTTEDRIAVLGEFESLDAAQAHLDKWWAGYWPKQVKSTRCA